MLDFSQNITLFAFCCISVKRARFTPIVWGVSLINRLYRVGDRTEPCGTPTFIHLGVDILPSTETPNFRCNRNELMCLVILVMKFNLDNL
jgi:hypothetical protein